MLFFFEIGGESRKMRVFTPAMRSLAAAMVLLVHTTTAFQGAALMRDGLRRAVPGGAPRAGIQPLPLRQGRAAPLRRGQSATAPSVAMSAASPPDFTVNVIEDKIPITLLSGFLGSGKTTLLREMLQNKGGLKVGVVVNDMAAINIDAKLVKSDSTRPKGDSVLGGGLLDTSDVLELQNGCACCSASEELLSSVMKLLLVSAEREEPYDRIVIEMSGVAEPKNIRKQFFDAGWGGHPALEYAELKNMVTVVDSANFLRSLESAEAVFERPDLFEEDSALKAADRAIVDLLTEQVEVADYILLNKADTVDDGKKEQLHAIVSALNPGADIITCTYGKVDLDVVLGCQREKWVADADDEDDFRVSVRAAAEAQKTAVATGVADKAVAAEASASHGHAHSHESGAHSHDACQDEECTDASHGHSHGEKATAHSHDHGAEPAGCADDECADPSHGHGNAELSHGHAHSHEAHSHEAVAASACADPECTDESHSHGHAHAHSHDSADLSPQDKFGISSFVYSRRKPFHPERMKKLIARLPVSSGQDKAGLEGWVVPELATAAEQGRENPLRNVIRSKGFVWVSTYHRVALYWSHAGQFFDLKDFGMFWAATPLKYWPRETAERAQVIADFGMGDRWGDRRQEIVFIGVGLDQAKIEAILDEALLDDQEMLEYEKNAVEFPDKVKMDWTTSPPIPMDVNQPASKAD
jgi:G3E family GTPase